MEQLTNQQRDQHSVQPRLVNLPPNLNGDFALGQRMLPRSVEQPDFARGQEMAPLAIEGPDFARGERTLPPALEGPDYARGLREAGQ